MEQEQVPLTAISYEYLLKGLVRTGNSRDVMDTLTTMKERGMEPTLPTYGYAIRACLENNNSTMAYDLMKEAEAANLPLQTEPRLLMDVLRTCALNDKVRRKERLCHGLTDWSTDCPFSPYRLTKRTIAGTRWWTHMDFDLMKGRACKSHEWPPNSLTANSPPMWSVNSATTVTHTRNTTLYHWWKRLWPRTI